MKRRAEAVVNVVGNPGKLHAGAAEIKFTGNETTPFAMRWTLFVGTDVIATCEYAKRLADWAFEHRAHSVRHDYDLKLSDNEP